MYEGTCRNTTRATLQPPSRGPSQLFLLCFFLCLAVATAARLGVAARWDWQSRGVAFHGWFSQLSRPASRSTDPQKERE
jgi:hypothetical protein